MEQDEVTMKRNEDQAEEFMRRTRMRLLKLEGKSQTSGQQAA
jgi:hypothetical protein